MLEGGEIDKLDFGSGEQPSSFKQALTFLLNHPFQTQFTSSSEDPSLFLTSTKKIGLLGLWDGWQTIDSPAIGKTDYDSADANRQSLAERLFSSRK